MTDARVSTKPTTLLSSAMSYTHPIWNEFHSKWGRDLAWVMLSPGLISGSLSGYANADKRLWGLPDSRTALVHWLHRQDSKLLQQPLSIPSRPRLGHYFEALLAFALADPHIQAINGLALLQRNIQIRSEKRTLGELDFLLQEQNKRGLHLEVAVKFYLLKRQVTNPRAWHHWIGPNAQDRLDLKLNRLIQHQLSWVHHDPVAQAEIAEIQQRQTLTPLSSAYYLKGMFFIHWLDRLQQPVQVNEQCLMGHWLTESEFECLNKTETLCFTRLEKQEWMAGRAEPGALGTPFVPPFMVAWHTRSEEKLTDSRIMVVPDYWAETNSPSRRI